MRQDQRRFAALFVLVLLMLGVLAASFSRDPDPLILKTLGGVGVIVGLFGLVAFLNSERQDQAETDPLLIEAISARDHAEQRTRDQERILADTVQQRDQYLSEVKQAVENADEAKDQLLSVVSHELRTPLTPIMAVVSALLADPDLDLATRGMVLIISDSLKVETRLIDNLLDAMRILRGKLAFRFDVVDAHEVIDLALGFILPDAGVNLQKDFRASNSTMHGDRARLEQVFGNIVQNAIKFMPQGGDLAIRTSNTRNGSLAFVASFRDSGVGIAPEHLGGIFDAFEHAGPNSIRRYGGLGLSMAISKAVVEAHHGTIVASSEGVGLGSQFVVELPVIDLVSSQGGGTPPTLPIRLLYVEDDPRTATVYKTLFQREGFQVTPAYSKAEALKVASDDFDLVLSDVGLPDGYGWEVMEHIRDQWTVPGIAVSGYGSSEDIARSHQSGFHEHLVKPVDFPQLLQSMRRLARPRRGP